MSHPHKRLIPNHKKASHKVKDERKTPASGYPESIGIENPAKQVTRVKPTSKKK